MLCEQVDVRGPFVERLDGLMIQNFLQILPLGWMCPCQILSGPCQILSKGAPNIYLPGGEHFSTGLFLGSSSVSMPNAAAILDFAIGKKFFRKLVPMVEQYLPAKFCPNRIKGIHLPSRNVIFEPKLCRNSIFDRRQPSWILIKMKNSSTGLFLGSSSVSMPNFV